MAYNTHYTCEWSQVAAAAVRVPFSGNNTARRVEQATFLALNTQNLPSIVAASRPGLR